MAANYNPHSYLIGTTGRKQFRTKQRPPTSCLLSRSAKISYYYDYYYIFALGLRMPLCGRIRWQYACATQKCRRTNQNRQASDSIRWSLYLLVWCRGGWYRFDEECKLQRSANKCSLAISTRKIYRFSMYCDTRATILGKFLGTTQ